MAPSLESLRDADPKMYGELCERAHCYSEAIRAYESSGYSMNLLRAAELSNRLGRKDDVVKYARSALGAAEDEIERAKKVHEESVLSGWGTALALASAEERRKKVQSSIERMANRSMELPNAEFERIVKEMADSGRMVR